MAHLLVLPDRTGDGKGTPVSVLSDALLEVERVLEPTMVIPHSASL